MELGYIFKKTIKKKREGIKKEIVVGGMINIKSQ